MLSVSFSQITELPWVGTQVQCEAAGSWVGQKDAEGLRSGLEENSGNERERIVYKPHDEMSC